MNSEDRNHTSHGIEASYRMFLRTLIDEYASACDSPLRPHCFCMTEDEIEGEAYDFLSCFLDKKRCPFGLKTALINGCVETLLKQDLHTFILENGDPGPAQYDAKSVSMEAFKILLDLCRSWVVDLPANVKLDARSPFHSCSHAVKNKRRKMEDRHIAIPDFNRLFGIRKCACQQALFGVFDGHGGVDAADYAASQLPINLRRNMKLSSQPLDALREAFVQTDSHFVKKAGREKLRCGSTAAVAFIQDKVLHVAWLGDSQVVLSKSGQAFQVMMPHKPDREDERQRIEKLGGCVVFFGGWRVNGSLAVSRAIGDYEQKPYITGEPDIESYDLDGDEEFLILACDGLWDTVEPQDAVDQVHQCMRSGVRDAAAERLVEQAVKSGSMDNVTVMVVYLDSLWTMINDRDDT